MRFSLRPARITSALVLVAVINVYVFATGTIVPKSTSESASAKVLLGKLVTTSNRPIIVNGAEAITGTLILSGAQLTTPAASLATVQLDNLGTVSIAPKSNVTLTFDSKNVVVKVSSGDATLSTAKGVTGTVVGPSGEPRNAPAPVDADEARNWGIAGVAIGSAAFIWAWIAWKKANDADDRAAALETQLAALRACLAGQRTSPVAVCTSF